MYYFSIIPNSALLVDIFVTKSFQEDSASSSFQTLQWGV